MFGIFQYRWHWRQFEKKMWCSSRITVKGMCACISQFRGGGFERARALFYLLHTVIHTQILLYYPERNIGARIRRNTIYYLKNKFSLFIRYYFPVSLPVSGIDPSSFFGIVVDEIHFPIVVSPEIPTVGQRYLSVPSSWHCIISIKVDSPNRIHQRKPYAQLRRCPNTYIRRIRL